MKNNVQAVYGNRVTYSRYNDGTSNQVTDGGSAGSYTAHSVHFYCSNGTGGSNRLFPTTMSFKKISNSGSISRFSRISGEPYGSYTRMNDSTWTYVPRDITGYYGRGMNWQGLYDECLQSIYDQLRNGHGNAAVDLAESAQVIQMIRNATSVRKLAQTVFKSVRTKRKYTAAQAAKYAGDKWLEYRYGWLPLISSTYELLKTLSKKVDQASIVVLEARAGEQIPNSGSSYTEPGAYGTPRYVSKRIQGSGRCLLKVKMKAKTTLDVTDFTSLNPLGIAWELLPFSFVVDWFVTVGQTLQLWEDHILFANRFVDGFRTFSYLEEFAYSHSEYKYSSPPYWPGTGQQMDGFLYEYSDQVKSLRVYKEKSRERLLSLPTPGGPRINVNVGARRLLDAAALIRGVFEKAGRR